MDDIQFIRQLMKENSKSLGFIPISAVKKAYNEGRVFLYYTNNKKIGYLLFGPVKKGKDVTIWQMCIDKQKRRRGFGKKLFNRLYRLALKTSAKGIRLRCADDLPANQFWKSLGFQLVSTVLSKRRRKINIYYLPLYNYHRKGKEVYGSS